VFWSPATAAWSSASHRQALSPLAPAVRSERDKDKGKRCSGESTALKCLVVSQKQQRAGSFPHAMPMSSLFAAMPYARLPMNEQAEQADAEMAASTHMPHAASAQEASVTRAMTIMPTLLCRASRDPCRFC